MSRFCRCEQCSKEPLPTWTQEYKRRCLVRFLVRQRRPKRLAFYRAFARANGELKAYSLVREVSEYWRNGRER